MRGAPALRRLSITARLTLSFAAVSLAVMAGVGLHLYRVLNQELGERDQHELDGKVELVRNLLREFDSTAAIVRSAKRWHEVFVGHHGLHLNLLDGQRRLILATSSLRLPEDALAAAMPEADEPLRVSLWNDGGRGSYRLTTAWGQVGGGSERVLIVLALEQAEREEFAHMHRNHVLAAVILGTLAAAVLGFVVSRLSLTRVREIAGTASEITASDLDRRLDVAHSPDELKALAVAFNHMLERLQDSFRRLSEFSSDIAHELRTPINNLLGQSQVALSRERSAVELREVLVSNVEEYERLARMIDDMLFLARADNAQEELRRERFDARDEIDKVASFFELPCEERGVRVVARGHAQVHADRALLRRAVANLLSNAIRHTPAGGLIELRARSNGDASVEISVANEGEPISPERLPRLFDRFYRADAARVDSSRGAGLGLAIVKSIMALHGGRVMVKSGKPERTTFTLYLPPAPKSAA